LCVALLFVPFLYVAVHAIWNEDGLRSDAWDGLADLPVLSLLVRSLLLAVSSIGIALVLGGGAAWILERRAFPLSGLLRLGALAVLVIPPVFQVAVWEKLLLPGGLVTTALPGLLSSTGFSMRNVFFAAWIFGVSYSPIFFFFVSQGLRSLPVDLLDAARVARGPWAVRSRIVAPLCAPWAIAGVGLTFPLVFLNYEVPSLLDVNTYAVILHVAFGARNDPGAAFAAVVPAFLVACFVAIAAFRWADRRGFALTGKERESGEPARDRPAPGLVAWGLFGGWWILVALLPIGVLLFLSGSVANWVEAWWTDWEKVTWGVLIHVTTAAIAALLAGALLLLGPAGSLNRKAGNGSWALWILLCFPGSLLAFALLRFGSYDVFFPIYNSWWILVVAGVARFFPVAYLVLRAHLVRVPQSQWEAARFVPTRWGRWWRVRVPLVAPGLTAAAVAVALLASQELAAAVLLAPPGHEPLLVRIYNLLHYDKERGTLAALAFFHVAAVLGVAGGFLFAGHCVAGRRRR